MRFTGLRGFEHSVFVGVGAYSIGFRACSVYAVLVGLGGFYGLWGPGYFRLRMLRVRLELVGFTTV